MSKNKIAKYKDLLCISVIDNGEKLINISKNLTDCICVCHKPDMKKYTGDEVWVRESIANKLKKISEKLKNKKSNYLLKIVYGYRHIDVQKDYFKKRRDFLKIQNPTFSKEKLDELTHSEVAHPSVAGHPTGGAIDITIFDLNQNRDLDMGTSIADFSNEEKIKTFYKKLTKKQKENRLLLHDLMKSENFAPFYGEWWHFSYGDKEWAWFYNKNNALYNQIIFSTKKQ